MLNIVTTQFTFHNKMLEIFIAGCSHSSRCASHCHNRELWTYDIGINMNEYKIRIQNKLEEFNEQIDVIAVTGGEPLDRPVEQLVEFLQYLTQFDKKIILFTHYELDDIPELVKLYCDMIKTGIYDIDQKGEKEMCGIKLQSKNQHIHILNKGEYYND